MQLADPAADRFDGQVIYLDFDGASDLTYNGPVKIDHIDVPAFKASGDQAGQESALISTIVADLQVTFAGSGLCFTTTQPTSDEDYSTIYIGGDDSAFRDYGSFLGLAEGVDAGNQYHTDNAFVFPAAVSRAAVSLPSIIGHEVGHLLGWRHGQAAISVSPLDDVAAGTKWGTVSNYGGHTYTIWVDTTGTPSPDQLLTDSLLRTQVKGIVVADETGNTVTSTELALKVIGLYHDSLRLSAFDPLAPDNMAVPTGDYGSEMVVTDTDTTPFKVLLPYGPDESAETDNLLNSTSGLENPDVRRRIWRDVFYQTFVQQPITTAMDSIDTGFTQLGTPAVDSRYPEWTDLSTRTVDILTECANTGKTGANAASLVLKGARLLNSQAFELLTGIKDQLNGLSDVADAIGQYASAMQALGSAGTVAADILKGMINHALAIGVANTRAANLQSFLASSSVLNTRVPDDQQMMLGFSDAKDQLALDAQSRFDAFQHSLTDSLSRVTTWAQLVEMELTASQFLGQKLLTSLPEGVLLEQAGLNALASAGYAAILKAVDDYDAMRHASMSLTLQQVLTFGFRAMTQAGATVDAATTEQLKAAYSAIYFNGFFYYDSIKRVVDRQWYDVGNWIPMLLQTLTHTSDDRRVRVDMANEGIQRTLALYTSDAPATVLSASQDELIRERLRAGLSPVPAAPVLTNADVSGCGSNWTFRVDVAKGVPDGQPPSVRLILDGNPYVMQSAQASGTTATYSYTFEGLGLGAHTFRFDATDHQQTSTLPSSENAVYSLDVPVPQPNAFNMLVTGPVAVDGKSVSQITVTITNDLGAPAEGVMVAFSSTFSSGGFCDELGNIGTGWSTRETGADGVATTYYRPTATGNITVRAEAEGNASLDGELSFQAVAASNNVLSLRMTLVSSGDGQAIYRLRGSATDAAGHLLLIGTPVGFSTDAGSLSANLPAEDSGLLSLGTTMEEEGVAYAYLRTTASGQATVRFTVGGQTYTIRPYLQVGSAATKTAAFFVGCDEEVLSVDIGGNYLVALTNNNNPTSKNHLYVYSTTTWQLLRTIELTWSQGSAVEADINDSGTMVFIGLAASKVGFINPTTGAQVWRTGLSLDYDDVAISPNGQLGAAYNQSGGGIVIFNASDASVNRTVLSGCKGIRALEFSPDGRWLAVSQYDGNIQKLRLINTATWTEQWLPVTGDSGASPKAIAWAPDSSKLALATGSQRTVRVFSAATGAELQQFVTNGAAAAIDWSNDGEIAVHCFDNSNTVEVHDAATGQLLYLLAPAIAGDSHCFATMAWTGPGHQLAVVSRGNSGVDAIHVFGEAPLAPTGVSVLAASNQRINLTWQPGNYREDGFQIDRATDHDFTQNVVTSTIGSDRTLFLAGPLAPQTTYYFRVRSMNATGTSEYSPVISATTTPVESGAVLTWGDNSRSQRNAPASLTNATAVSSAITYSLAIQGGSVTGWGYWTDGEGSSGMRVPTSIVDAVSIDMGMDMGAVLRADGTVTAFDSYTNYPSILTNAVAVAVSSYTYLVALLQDGTVATWGYGPDTPTGLSNVVGVDAGTSPDGAYVLAVTADGSVIAWGDNSYGRCNVPSGLTDVIAVSAGPVHALALRSDGTVVAWGGNSSGQCSLPGDLTGVVSIAAGEADSLALKSDGTVVAWGTGANATQCPTGLSGVVAIAAGSSHAVALVQGPVSVAASTNLTGRVELTWSNSSSAIGSRVWRGTTFDRSAATCLTQTPLTGSTYSDKTAVADVTYCYWIEQINSTGNSTFSLSVSGKAIALIPPDDNVLAGAHPATIGATIEGYAIAPNTDVDLFALAVPSDMYVQVSVLPSRCIRLFDSNGSQLAVSRTGAPFEYWFPTGGTYYLGVSATLNYRYNPVDGSGATPGPGGPYTLTIMDTVALSSGPVLQNDTGISTTDGLTKDQDVTLSWGAVVATMHMVSYEYKMDDDPWSGTPDTSIAVAATPGTHTFSVRAFDEDWGVYGPALATQVTVDVLPPSAPGELTLHGDILSWTAGDDSLGLWKHQYAVDGGQWSDVTGISVVTGLAVGSTHTFAVRAVDAAGNVGPEAVATLTVAQTAPTGVSASWVFQDRSGGWVFQDRIAVSWNNSPFATGYQVWRSEMDDPATAVDLTPLCPTGTTYDDTMVLPGIRYYYWVTAVGASEISGFSDSASAVVPAYPPDHIDTVAAPDGVIVNWRPSCGATGYQIWRGVDDDPDTAVCIASVDATATTAKDIFAVAGQYYTYWVRTEYVAGVSDFSPPGTGWVLMAPVAPSSIQATPVSPTQINIRWQDNSGDEDGFEIQVALSSDYLPDPVLTVTSTVGANTGLFVSTGLLPGITYYCRVRSVNAAGASAYSRTMEVTTPLPNTPPQVNIAPVPACSEGDTVLAFGLFLDGDGGDQWTATVDYGDGSGVQPLAFWTDGSAFHYFNGEHTYLDNGNYTISVVVTDLQGATGESSVSVTVDNVAPMALLSNGGEVLENSPGTVGFTGQYDPSTIDVAAGFGYSFDFNNDGVFEIAGFSSPTAVVPAAYLADGPRSQVIRARIADKDGGFTDYLTALAVTNAAPTAVFSNGGSVAEGSQGAVSFSDQQDPSPADSIALRYSYDFDNDGVFEIAESSSPSAIVPAAFLAEGPGKRVVRARIADKDGGFTDYTTSIAITNADPTASFGNGGPVNENSSGTVAFSNQYDPSPVDAAAGFTYSYDFNNDGVFEIVGSSSATAAVPATYLKDGPGVRVVRGRISDKDGGFADYTTSIAITNIAPTATMQRSISVREGSPGYIRFTQQADASPLDAAAGYRYSYDFNNDGVFDLLNSTSASVTVPASYLTDGPGTQTVRARIADKDGGYTDYTAAISILNAPPTISLANNGTGVAGTPFVCGGSFMDPGAFDTWTATADYGDKTGAQPLALNPDKTFTLGKTYALPGTYTITVRVMDDDGGVGIIKKKVTISAPSLHATAVINDGSAQRSMVTNITYTFNTAVTLSANAFVLTRVDGAAAPSIAVSNPSGDRKTFVLTFTGTGVVGGSLADRRYTLRLYASRVRDDFGQTLSGGDSILNVHRIFGDGDGDGDTDTTDLLAFRGSLNKRVGDPGYLGCFDYDGNGIVDTNDYTQFRLRLGKTI
jgi:WD40 repeat protein